MQEAFLTGEDLDEGAEIQDAHDLAVVDLARFGNGADVLDALQGGIHSRLVHAKDIHDTLCSLHTVRAGNFLDGNGSTGLFLESLDGLATLADNGTDKLGSHLDLHHARHEGLVVLTRFADGLHHFAHDVQATLTGLLEGFLQYFVAQAVHLDIHLGSGDAVLGTGHLEVHIAQVIFVTQDIGQDGIAVIRMLGIGDQTHGHTGHRLADLHAGVHEGEAAAADGSLRRGTVGFQDIGNDAHGVREFRSLGHDGLEGTPGQVSVADFTAADTARSTGVTGRERREVIVQDKLLLTLDQHLVHLFHIQLGTQGDGSQRLGLATGKDGAAVGARQAIDLAPDGTHGRAVAAVQADTFVQDHVAHGLFLFVGIVAGHHGGFGLLVLFGQGSQEVGLDLLKGGGTLLLGQGGLGHGVALVIAELVDGLAQVLVLLVVRIVTFDGLAAVCVQFFLDAAVLLDFFVGELDGLEHHVLGDLVHLAFHHHDVLFGSGDHQFQVGFLHFGEVRVDDELAVDAAHAHLGDRSQEGKVAGGESGRGGQAGEGVGLDVLLGGDEPDVHKYGKVEIVREEGTQGAVHQAGDQDLVVRGLAFAFHKTARETSGGVEFFFVIHLQGEEIRSFRHFFGAGDRREQHRAAHPDNSGTVGLLGQFSGLNLDHPTVGQFDCFLDNVHFVYVFTSSFYSSKKG